MTTDAGQRLIEDLRALAQISDYVCIKRYLIPAADLLAKLSTPSDGACIIGTERHRQIEAEGWTSEHDDDQDGRELSTAAACYALPEHTQIGDRDHVVLRYLWPWDKEWWKPTPKDRIRELAKAGALIAAEIDRLLRLKKAASRSTGAADVGEDHR